MFDAKLVKEECVAWIRAFFKQNGPDCKAVIGISGGKDSSVVAALCVEALGKDRVLGVLMPQGYQPDIDYSQMLVDFLGIESVTIDIEDACDSIFYRLPLPISDQTKTNLPARIRMATLYAVSQSVNGRVSNNCNLSEDYVGYSTRWGDSVGDFSPISNLTVTEVKAIGKELGLPEELINKTPSDGLCGKTDEDNLGFSYEVLDTYIRTRKCANVETYSKIEELHKKNQFKLRMQPSFPYNPIAYV